MKLAQVVALLALSASSLAWAGPSEPYSAARFEQLAQQGKPILVAIHADWCPTCKAQKPILKELMARPEYKNVTELTVDFDHDPAALKKFHAVQQSTLVAFKGEKEVGRSIGDTNKTRIEGLVKKTAR